MKKLFLFFATVTLLIGFQACKQKEEAVTDDTIEVVADEPVVEPDSIIDTTRTVVPPVDRKPTGG